MAQPVHPTLDLTGTTFTFTNEGVKIVAETIVGDTITVQSVALDNHHGTVDLPITDLVVPTPVAEHLFDLLPPI
jgi:hypothetical protein